MNVFKKIAHSQSIILVAIILISLLALWPFFKQGYFVTHDGEWMVIRFSAFHQTLKAGQFPVRFVDRLNNNYGYPVLNFLYPLPFYLSEIPKTIFNFATSIKIVFVVSTIASTLLMFVALKEKFSKEASIAGSIIYLYTPYRFVDLYVRGSIGENLAFAFLPLVLLSIFKIEKKILIFLPVLSISVVCLILSHNVIAAIFSPIFILLLAISLKDKERFHALLAFFLGILISAFFSVPALFDLHYVMLSKITIADTASHLVPLSKLIYSKWAFGPVPKENDGFSAQIGIMPIAVFMFATARFIYTKRKSHFIMFILFIFLLSIFLISSTSYFIWKTLPYVSVIQFPWRLLSVIVFATAILTAYIIDESKKKFIFIIVIFFAVSSTIFYTKPQQYVNREDSFYSTNEATTTVKDEYLPLWVIKKPTTRADTKFESKDILINDETINPAKYKATIEALSNTTLTINTIYFPGFFATVDDIPVAIAYNNDHGLMQIPLIKGKHQVIINYSETAVHIVSELISIAALLLTGFIFIYLWRKQNFL